ncbi:MAG: hypothetical protein OXG24_06630 [Gammaproteobacteria bacterium]|nr:hypothetical protein [Gammaproteobacteria bacterium]
MIIPPAAITIGALVVITKLLLTGLFHGSSDSETTTLAKVAEPGDAELLTSCRYKSKTMPFRDLSPTTKPSTAPDLSKDNQSVDPASNTENPNNEALAIERVVNKPQSESETLVITEQ